MFTTRSSISLTDTARHRAVTCVGLTALVALFAGCDVADIESGPPPNNDSIFVTITPTDSPTPGAFGLRADTDILGGGNASGLRYAWSVVYGDGVFEPSADQPTVTLRATQAGPCKVRVEVTMQGIAETAWDTHTFTVDGELNVSAVAVPDASNNGDFQLFADVVEEGEFTYTWETDSPSASELVFEDSGQATLNLTVTEEDSYRVFVRVARTDADGLSDLGWAQVWFSYGAFLYEIYCPDRVLLGEEEDLSRTLVNAPHNPTGDRVCGGFNIVEGDAEILDREEAWMLLRFDTLGDVVVNMHLINVHTGRNGELDTDCDNLTVGGDDIFIGEINDECTIEVIRDETVDIDDPCGEYVDYYNSLPCLTDPLQTSTTCDPMSASICVGIDEFYDCLIDNTNCVDGALVEDIDPCGLLLNCGM